MKKTILILFNCILALFACFCFAGCKSCNGAEIPSTSSSVSTGDSSQGDGNSEDSSDVDNSVSYTITYNLGILEDNPDVVITSKTQTVYFGKAFTLPVPSYGKYKFVCWTQEGETDAFEATTYPFEDSITLVATWKVPYTITYDLGVAQGVTGATVSKQTQTVYYEESFTLPTATCPNYRFVAWKLQLQDKLFTSTYFPYQEDITLVATWKLPYIITFNLGIVEGDPTAYIASSTKPAHYNENVQLPIPTCSGYKFTYWTIEGENTELVSGKYPYKKDIVLVANWKREYTITYNFGDLEGNEKVKITSKTQAVYYGESFTVYTPTCDGYEFTGWTLDGQAFTDTTYAYEEGITLVATWKEREYTGYH